MTTREQGLRDVARHPQKGHKALRALVWAAAAALLLLPWVAMQFTPEVNWTSLDFVVFGGMLLLACGSCEIALRVATGTCYLLAAGLAVLGVFLQVWANLAVGIIGNEGNPANLMFLAIPVVGVVGALISRFRPAGMVLTLEPGLEIAPGRGMVHEENLVVREDGPQLLSRRAPPELPIVATGHG